jgi:hypothetical protein
LDISNDKNESESEKLQRLSRKRELDEEFIIDDNDQNPRKKFEQEDFDDWRFVFFKFLNKLN